MNSPEKMTFSEAWHELQQIVEADIERKIDAYIEDRYERERVRRRLFEDENDAD